MYLFKLFIVSALKVGDQHWWMGLLVVAVAVAMGEG